MSLTRQLRDSKSPIARFMRENFPGTRGLTAWCREQMAGATVLAPPEGQTGAYHSALGTAMDYRIRFALGEFDLYDTVAVDGADLAVEAHMLSDTAVRACLDEGVATVARLKPAGRRLPAAEERELNALCWVLALFDQVLRAGAAGCENSPLFLPSQKKTAAGFLAIAPEPGLTDMAALSQRFFETQSGWLGRPVILNPQFDGSGDIGGADGDFIVDGCLIEVKSSVSFLYHASALFYQLMGYLLLDYSATLQLSSVGFYACRYGIALSWPVDEFLARLSDGQAPSISTLRQRFKALLESQPGFIPA